MAEFANNPYGFKEAVTLQAERIFDSCSDRDCLEDLEVVFPDFESNQLVNEAAYAKARCCEVTSAYFQIEPIQFNKGFYSVDITYTFNIEVELSTSASAAVPTNIVNGTASFTKKVILYGSEGGTKLFTSDDNGSVSQNGCCYNNPPRAQVAVADPIVLGLRLVTIPAFSACTDATCETAVTIPSRKVICCTLGMFSIVSLSRNVPVMVPSFDYEVPSKECTSSTESPCELFDKISFPTGEFFPKSLEDATGGCSNCGCNDNND